ncbi:MAG: SDR family oxidoreductase [Rhodobacteraceae bacterium]|nr:SDR family oxidoreductase [Paracoccaceae bacterium]
MTLSGKRAVITGSTSGIGLGIARAMAGAGADIVLNSFTNTDDDHALATDLSDEFGISARYIQADMSKSEQCRSLIEESGNCDILINNAGIQHVSPIDEFPIDKWNAIIAINLSSAFHTTAAALPKMRAAGWGRVINISSAHGLTASPFKSAYIAAKHGIIGLTKTTAIPATMEKYDMERDEVIKKVMLERQPSREFATVEQIGGTCVFLSSPAANQITGTTISVDGGWTAL